MSKPSRVFSKPKSAILTHGWLFVLGFQISTSRQGIRLNVQTPLQPVLLGLQVLLPFLPDSMCQWRDGCVITVWVIMWKCGALSVKTKLFFYVSINLVNQKTRIPVATVTNRTVAVSVPFHWYFQACALLWGTVELSLGLIYHVLIFHSCRHTVKSV